MAIRNLPQSIKEALVENKPLKSFHLIKFEKPSDIENPGLPTDFVYLTDSPHEVEWEGNTYVPGSVVSLGAIEESAEAKASSSNLVLSATKLGANAIATLTNTTATAKGSQVTLSSTIDLFKSGFYPGDTVTLNSRTTSNSYNVRLDTFSNSGTTLTVTSLDDAVLPTFSDSFDIVYSSPEVSSITGSSLSYANYVNRTLDIYKVYTDPVTNEWLDNDPIFYFKGIISKVNLKDSADGSSTITWSLTSHWGDFVSVQGRITSDEYHRGLNGEGIPAPDAVLRPAYAYDKGFEHAETALNVTATYTDLATRTNIRKRGGLARLFGGVKSSEETYEVDRELDLNLNLSSKFLPVVYGVQKIDSVPVFADVVITKDSNSSDNIASGKTELYMANALCEGPIGGIYDVYSDNSGIICRDLADSDASTTCIGRMDRGDVLGGDNFYSLDLATDEGIPEYLYEELGEGTELDQIEANRALAEIRQERGDFSHALISDSGILHEQTFSKSSSENIMFTLHSGLDNQRADQTLMNLSATGKFLVQNNYYENNPLDYWNTSHQLLDTAYVVSKDSITAEDGKASEYSYVVRGKFVNCYNYDGTYRAHVTTDTSISDNFLLGQQVSVLLDTGETSSAYIVDKFSFYDIQGELDVRFKLECADTNVNTIINSGNANKITMTAGGYTWVSVSEGYIDSSFVNLESPYEIGNYFSFNSLADVPLTRKVERSTRTYSWASYADIITQYTLDFSGLNSASKNLIKSLRDISDNTTQLYNISIVINSTTILVPVTSINTTSFIATLNTKNRTFDALLPFFDFAGVDGEFNHSTTISSVSFSTQDVMYRDSLDTTDLEFLQNTTVELNQADKNPISAYVLAPTDTTLYNFVNTNRLFIFNTGKGTLEGSYTYSFGTRSTTVVNKNYGDYRVSINPSLQTLDYITNKRYGKGLDLNLIDLPSFIETALACEQGSDVLVLANTSESITIGGVYSYSYNGNFTFRGKVSDVSTITYEGTSYKQVTFTDVVGKLGNKWFDWKTYEIGDLVYSRDGLYASIVTAKGTIVEPTGAISTLTLNKQGGGSFNVETSLKSFSDKNPFVKQVLNLSDGSQEIVSGYSLYDSDGVSYWKYLGWDSHKQRNVTRHQTNIVIDTSSSVFDNINSLLSQFNGIFRYSQGKYSLTVKTKSKDLSSYDESIEVINEDSIVGDISLQDKGISKTYNSITASIIDPQNAFSSRNISFFNSDYLKQDKGIKRQGNFKAGGISNYYNARLNIKQLLDESRAGLTISMTVAPKGYLLLAGELFALSFNRFNWNKKLFRISTLKPRNDGLVDIVATEHNDDAFILDSLSSSIVGKYSSPTNKPITSSLPPSALAQIEDGRKGGISLIWSNSSDFNRSSHDTEIWRSNTPSFEDAALIATTSANTYLDKVLEDTAVTRYYWIRHSVTKVDSNNRSSISKLYSSYYPLTSESGIEAVGDGLVDGITVTLSNDNVSVQSLLDGTPISFDNTSTTITAFIGSTALDYDNSSPYSKPSFRVSNVVASGATLGTPSTTTNSYQSGTITGMSNDAAVITYTIVVTNALGSTTTFEKVQTFTKALEGPQGTVGPQGTIGPEGPTGNPGATGPQGPQGTIGPEGPTGNIGATGPQGPQGTIGPEGPTGAIGGTGPQGPQGTIGPTGIIGATGAQGPSGPQGTIGPEGPTGNPGATGPQGPQGTIGPTGIIGATGAQGPSGPQGTIGPEGPTGNPGATGPTGAQGTVGPVGPTGNPGATGPQGPQGTVGPVGPTGAIGSTGPQGPQGTVGPVGPTGAIGSTGPQGPQGTVGPVGPTGAIGSTGPQGPQGTVGPVGPTGAIGSTGPQGPQGTVGPVGPTGNPGLTGPQGPQGTVGPVGPTGNPGLTGPQGPQGTVGPTGIPGVTGGAGPTGPQGPIGTVGPTGGAGSVGPTGPAGDPGAAIAFDTATAIADDAGKKTQIELLRSPALAGDVYWHVGSDRAWKYSGSSTTFTELDRVSNYNPGGTNTSVLGLDGTNNRIVIYDSNGNIRVKIGNLS